MVAINWQKYALCIFQFSLIFLVPYKPLNQQRRLKNTKLLIQRFVWYSTKFYKICKIHKTFSESSTIFICLVKCMFVPNILKIMLNLNFWYYPRPMYPGQHGDTQFCPFLDCFSYPKMRPHWPPNQGERLERLICEISEGMVFLVCGHTQLYEDIYTCVWLCQYLFGYAHQQWFGWVSPRLYETASFLLRFPGMRRAVQFAWGMTPRFFLSS